MRTGKRARIHKAPHFRVKCHRSRSNNENPKNDQYLASDFDVIITIPLNALYAPKSIGEDFDLVSEEGLLEILYTHYNVSDREALLDATSRDWRFALPGNIAEKGLIPREPFVLLSDDPNWLPLDQIQSHLEAIVRAKVQAQARRSS